MGLTIKQESLRTSQLVKRTILTERSRKGLRTFSDPDSRLLPQFIVLMSTHNDVVGVINALIDYVEILKQRVEELENGPNYK